MLRIVQMIALALVLVVVLGLIYYSSLGGFRNIVITEEELGPHHFIYKNHVGAYNKIDSTMLEVYGFLSKRGLHPNQSMGVYHDDPREVAKDKLRSEGGYLLTEQQYQNLAKEGNLPEGFLLRTLPKANYVKAEFPFKGQMSILVGVLRVYPKMGAYLEAKNHPKPSHSIEVYSLSKEPQNQKPTKTTYLMPIVSGS